MDKTDKNSAHLGGKDKTRGIKHRKDKDKYRPKSTKENNTVHQKFKQSLGSNWDRYEKEDDSQNFQLTSSTDFSILANAPITQGQYFQFKHDKVLAEETEEKQQEELFSLDLNVLKHSILTVPFYERIGIDRNYFTENQLSYMKKNAELSFQKFNEKYNDSNKTTRESTIQDVNDRSSSTEIAKETEPESRNLPDVHLIGTEIDIEVSQPRSQLTDKMNDLVKPDSTQVIGKHEEDLEQWLDDILDQ